MVLRYLIGRIPDARVLGLTATLPSPEDGNEYENYASLLGDVDFEVPTPAVMKVGDLAPYRDLAYFTEPTRREMDYLNNVQRVFEADISRFTESVALQEWTARAVLGQEKDGKHLEEALNARPVLSLAALRYLRHASRPIPGDLLALPLEANEPPSLEDWAALLERYALDHLQTNLVLLRPLFPRFEDYPPAYHPVPDVLATRKENADAFARHWHRYVGGETFVYTRSPEGRRMLLKARAQQRPEVRDLAFEVWY